MKDNGNGAFAVHPVLSDGIVKAHTYHDNVR